MHVLYLVLPQVAGVLKLLILLLKALVLENCDLELLLESFDLLA